MGERRGRRSGEAQGRTGSEGEETEWSSAVQGRRTGSEGEGRRRSGEAQGIGGLEAKGRRGDGVWEA